MIHSFGDEAGEDELMMIGREELMTISRAITTEVTTREMTTLVTRKQFVNAASWAFTLNHQQHLRRHL